jgi:Transcriptional regulatory protein, C terminal
MKRNYLIIIGLVAMSAFLLSAGSIITRPDPTAFPQKEVAIAVRNVGHLVMLHTGDSVSRILPVKQIDKHTYRLEFGSSFRFVPDSLVSIVKQSLAATSASMPYTVNVLECFSDQIVYGFQIGKKEQTTLVPCLGREQPTGCYIIMISFLPDSHLVTSNSLFVLALASLVVVGFVGRSYLRMSKPIVINDTQGITIGAFKFYEERRQLKFNQSLIDLSDKETRLLKIFIMHKNELVSRSQLMKEVWNDDGALVSRSLDVFISRLRKKLKDDPNIQIMNAHGLGYTLSA